MRNRSHAQDIAHRGACGKTRVVSKQAAANQVSALLRDARSVLWTDELLRAHFELLWSSERDIRVEGESLVRHEGKARTTAGQFGDGDLGV
jgi:hypothetical protein